MLLIVYWRFNPNLLLLSTLLVVFKLIPILCRLLLAGKFLAQKQSKVLHRLLAQQKPEHPACSRERLEALSILRVKRLPQRLISAVPHVTLDVRRVSGLIGVFEDQSEFLRHGGLTPIQKSLRSRRSGLPDGVTVAQQTLDLFVMVQIHVGQPTSHLGRRIAVIRKHRFHLPSATTVSALETVTFVSNSSFTITTGAFPQSARHSTNSTVKRPSGVVCGDRKSTRLNSSHSQQSRMPSSA